MQLKELPVSYTEWLSSRAAHIQNDLQQSTYTSDLFLQYKKHLGPLRYHLLVQVQQMLVPGRVADLLHYKRYSYLQMILPLYHFSRYIKMDKAIKNLLLPPYYKAQI